MRPFKAKCWVSASLADAFRVTLCAPRRWLCMLRRPLGAEVDWELSSFIVSFGSLCRFNARGGGVFCVGGLCMWSGRRVIFYMFRRMVSGQYLRGLCRSTWL